MNGAKTRSGKVSIVGWMLALIVTAAIVAGSRLPMPNAEAVGAEIVLSWRYQETAAQECRPYTEEELAQLPVHMRGSGICERQRPSHRLLVELDGQVAVDRVIRAGGRSGDRPISVLERIPVDPGPHKISVTFFSAGSEGEGASADPGGADTDRSGPDPLAAGLDLVSGEIVLITLGETSGQFELRQRSAAGS